jgi:DNA polymerase
LRKSLRAPPGYVVVVGDESQVECRVDGWLAKQQDLCDQFERGEDVYSIFAGKVVGHEVTKKNKPERFLGKTATLGLGFGMGWLKFQLTVRTKSRLDLGQLIALSDADSQHIVTLYRTINFMIVRLWSHCENLLPSIQAGVMTELGVVFTRKDEIVGPNGLRLRYRNLRKEMRPAYGTDKLKPTWVYDWGRETKTLFGGKVCENIVQFLARIVVMDAAVRIRKTTGFAFAHQGHDELSYVVPKSEGEGMKQVLTEELSRRPSWAPGLPLACEVGIGECYGEAK